MGMVGVLALLWGLTKDSLVAIILFIILLCVLILVLYKWLSYKGKKRFLSL
jgi:membrane protein implicated in regulation of membrane protease activity